MPVSRTSILRSRSSMAMACSPTLAHSEGESLVYELVAVVGLPRLESGLHGGEGLVAPLGESG